MPRWEYGVRFRGGLVWHGDQPLTKAQAKEYMVSKSDRLVRRRIKKWKRV